MEPLNIDSCEHASQIYPEASQVCCYGACMVCRHGEWVELREWPGEERDSE